MPILVRGPVQKSSSKGNFTCSPHVNLFVFPPYLESQTEASLTASSSTLLCYSQSSMLMSPVVDGASLAQRNHGTNCKGTLPGSTWKRTHTDVKAYTGVRERDPHTDTHVFFRVCMWRLKKACILFQAGCSSGLGNWKSFRFCWRNQGTLKKRFFKDSLVKVQ